MSEPYWVPLGAQAVDYEGAYAAGTQYVPGDVVRYSGVDYMCVNPVLGTAPPSAVVGGLAVIPLVTTLPDTPFDGQEVILTDSLTAGTYFWRLRYVAGIADAYKWVFIGGTEKTTTAYDPKAINAAVQVGTTGHYRVVGTDFVVPRAGLYRLDIAFRIDANGATGSIALTSFVGSALQNNLHGFAGAITWTTGGWELQAVTQAQVTATAAGQTIGACVTSSAPATNKINTQQVLYRPARLA